MIPMHVSGVDQQEIVRLLCKVHQLEIENMESQSASLLRDFQIKKKDMVISRLRQHNNLSDDIIRRQRDLLDGKDEAWIGLFVLVKETEEGRERERTGSLRGDIVCAANCSHTLFDFIWTLQGIKTDFHCHGNDLF